MVYRQRLTKAGWVGAILFVIGPAATFLAITQAGFRGPEPLIVVICAFATLIAPILLLIGREHYRVEDEPEAPSEGEDIDRESLPPGMFYPGQPLS